MTRSIIPILFFVGITSVQGQEGIRFFEGSWTELVQAAKQQDKMIFVDVYTDWCAPCKEMSKVVFTKKQVGDKYNASFLSYKLNAEKGQGIALAKQYNVQGYPTYLYLNKSGELVYRSADYSEPNKFIGFADSALQQLNTSIPLDSMEAAFKKGKREPAFLREYIAQLMKLQLDYNTVLDEYFKTLSTRELSGEETVLYFGRNLRTAASPILVYVMERYNKLSKAAKQQLTNPLFSILTERGAYAAIKEQRLAELKQLLAYADQLEGRTEKQRRAQDRIRILYAGLIRNVELTKTAGYHIVQNLLHISPDSLKREDARRYADFIAPYQKGEKDSTEHSTWQEEQKYLLRQYSQEVAYWFYFAANAFADLPDTEQKALQDALAWARKAKEIDGIQKAYGELVERLERRVRTGG